MAKPKAGVPRASPPPAGAASSSSKAAAAKRSGSGDYASEGVQNNDPFALPLADYMIALFVTVLSAGVRLFRIYQPSSVVFDEVHFGGFASKYIRGRFFMDVHPPLAKMLITLFGWLAGFDGSFDFKEIGKDYVEPRVPYVSMRLFPAVCGILLAPIMFLTLKATGCRSMTALMGAGFIVFENGLLTQARLILLDSPLVIATAFTAFAFTSFANQHEQGPSKAFRPSWWFWLAMTGLGLGVTVSIKWVGLFTIAWVGAITLVQLWVLLGDYNHVSPRLLAKHFMARLFCLVIIPATFYMAMFGIHFLCLVNPGEGDGFMSSEFQATLNSKGMQDVSADVLMGSRVSLRHVNTQGGYLHSHPLMYPTGSNQQQITLYPHKDENNVWLLENQTQPLGLDGNPINGTYAWDGLAQLPYVEDGSVLRLYHTQTDRRLHSHDVRPPVSEVDWQNEVSAYGFEGFEGDANDLFRVEIVKGQSASGPAQTRLRTIESKFRLVHLMTGCTLFSHKVKLPEWASDQQEVTCARGGTLPNSLWYIEHNEHPQLGPDAEKVNYIKPGFFGKFWELHKVMWRTNAGLTDSHAWDSRPSAWPILRRGINFWGKDNRQIYLIGNPVVWWSSTVAVATYLLFKAVSVLRWQRSCNDYANVNFKRFDYEVGPSVLGWALHYFPFYLMQRQLFLHHYFPALYFAVLACCQIFDFAVSRVRGIGLRENPIVAKSLAVGFLAVVISSFVLLQPLAYGNAWTKSECKTVKLFDTWDFDCNLFLDSYDQYAAVPSISAAEQTVPQESAKAKEQPQLAPADNPNAFHQKPADAVVSPPPGGQPGVAGREERIEYRDQDGNLLDDEQVKSLEGKVEFKTKYETRTRLVDEAGNELRPEDVEKAQQQQQQPVAPPHPDVEGADPATKAQSEDGGSNGNIDNKDLPEPKEVDPSRDGAIEAEQSRAKPASEGQEATASGEE